MKLPITLLLPIIFLPTLFVTPLHAAGLELSKTETTKLCSRLKGPSPSKALWTSFDGVPIEGDIKLGVIDKAGESGAQEYVPAPNRYRLILSPARLTVSDQCSMSLCISFKKSKPRCPNTSEYVVEFSALPSKFGPGPFSTEERLVPEDPKEDYPLELDLLSGRALTGTIFTPWLAVEKAKNYPVRRPEATDKAEEYSSYEFRNSGNRPLLLKNWEKIEGSNPGINIASSTCAGAVLSPGSTCSLSFKIAPTARKIKKHTSFSTTSADDRLIFTLYANFDEKAEFSVSVKIQ